MLSLPTVIANIVNDLKTVTWTSPSGLGTTKFQAVFKYPNWEYVGGYPFSCVIIPTQEAQLDTTKNYIWKHRLEIHICVNWSVLDYATDNEKREEASVRLLEAVDYLRSYIGKDTTLAKWFTSPDGYALNISVNEANIFDLNLFRKVFIIELNDTTSKI